MIPGSGLLKLLGGAGAPQRPASPASIDPASPDFAAMLDKARAGEIASGRQVKLAKSAGVKLTAEQLERLALAADRAEAQGAVRALVLIDGQALRLDVTTREITGAADLSDVAVLTDIDTVVSMPSPKLPAEAPSLAPPGTGRAWSNASLLNSLAAAGDKTKAR